MTVSELIAKLKDCAPGADVGGWADGRAFDVKTVTSDGEKVWLEE
jgi:hypothetical protein